MLRLGRNAGFGLIQVLIGLGIMITLVLIISEFLLTQKKSSQTTQVVLETYNTANEFLSAMQRVDICNGAFAGISLNGGTDVVTDLMTRPTFANSPLGAIFKNTSSTGLWQVRNVNAVRKASKLSGAANNVSPYEYQLTMVATKDPGRTVGGESLRNISLGVVYLQVDSSNTVVPPYPCQTMPVIYNCPLQYSTSCDDASACQSTCMGQLQTSSTCVVKGSGGVPSTVNCPVAPLPLPQVYTCPVMFSSGCAAMHACESSCMGQDQLGSSCIWRDGGGVPNTVACTPK